MEVSSVSLIFLIDLLSSELKRKYELAAFDYVQRSIAPEAYKVNFYVDNGKGLRMRRGERRAK